MTYQPDILWCSSRDEVREALSASGLANLLESELTSERADSADLVVVDVSRLGADPVAKLASMETPTLILLPGSEFAGVVERLPEQHDLVLDDADLQVVLFRIKRLIAAAKGRRDLLTGLMVRRALLRRLEQSLSETHASAPTSVALIDIDDFKSINDQLGHTEGDVVLTKLAGVLRDISPAGVFLARYGGDEMAMIGRASAHGARTASEQIRENIAGRELHPEAQVTVSIGVATATRPIGAQALLREADEALYAAKAGGRNQVVHYRELAARAAAGGTDTALAAFENVTRVVSERVARVLTRRGRRLVKAVREQAEIDGVTELFTRRYLDRRLEEEFQLALRRTQPLCVALFDIDHFGAVNKTFGWPTGDKLLHDVASIARSMLRGDDWVARYGGDEISIVMPRTHLDDALTVMSRVRQALVDRDFESTNGDPVDITVSMGLAERQPSDRSVGELLERASDRLLQAKRGGRNRIIV